MENKLSINIIHMTNFEVYKSGNEYRWRLTTNGIIVGASSEGFHNESYCIENAKKVMFGIFNHCKDNNLLKQ